MNHHQAPIIHWISKDQRIRVIEGDITTARVDAIVNAANRWLMPGGGVDGAIHRAAGPALAKASAKLAPIEEGEAVITPGFNLQSPFVIHAVGPIWDEDENQQRLRQLLTQTYVTIFDLCQKHKIQTVAIPNISTGIYGFPKEDAATIVWDSTKHFMLTNPTLLKIDFYCLDPMNIQLYKKHAEHFSNK